MSIETIQQLPIFDVLDELVQVLFVHDELVLQAPPGAGKTTAVPLALLNADYLKRQKILMLEPRRMAAKTAANRMAELLGEEVGDTVGFRIRQESKVSHRTRVEVVTEGVLTRMLQDDPELAGIGLLIFDEFHERNINSDLGLALSLASRDLFREDGNPLKLLVMSATLDGDAVSKLLNDAPMITSSGKMFPVTVHYSTTPKINEPISSPILQLTLKAMNETSGSILVFLPGQREIQNLQQSLSEHILPTIEIMPLYGALDLSAQLKAIAPSSKRKIVLATDIAETSITIDGVTTVVDSGLSRQPRFDPVSGMTKLHTRRISEASSIQRMGRAGRTAKGDCYRLWSKDAQGALEKQTPAEILHADLAPLALQLLQWGITDLNELTWMDTPPEAHFYQATDLLKKLEALNGSLVLTSHGESMAKQSIHPRLAHMLIKAQELGVLHYASALAVLLSEKDPLNHYGSDIATKVSVLIGETVCEKSHQRWLKRSQQLMKNFQRGFSLQPSHLPTETEVITGLLLAFAYPDRIAMQRKPGSEQYLLSNGKQAMLKKGDRLSRHTFLVVADIGGRAEQQPLMFSAAFLDQTFFESELQGLVESKNSLEWSEQKQRFVAEKQIRCGALVLDRERLDTIDSKQREQALLAVVRQKGLQVLNITDDCQRLINRVNCLNDNNVESVGEIDWPDFSERGLLASLEQWLSPFIEGVNKLADFKKIDVLNALQTLLVWPLPQNLNELAPKCITVPSGSNIYIDYSSNPPVLAVKLQEMFGATETPSIANGKIKLLVHLLSPGKKPLQVTQDLKGFWQGSYVEVKKEMKGRYPRHPWPDDPMNFKATRLTKRGLQKSKSP